MSSELKRLVERKDLSEEEAFSLGNKFMKGELTESLMAGLLVALRMKGEKAEEIAGFARSMRSFMVKVEGKPEGLDTAGTGGDGMNTVNVSTASAVAMSTLVPVFKHGNRAVSSSSGSADVLEAFGYDINVKPGEVSEIVSKVNFVFLFAQVYHPAMRNVAVVRKSLGIRTLFNVLGPFTNPASVRRQVIGVFSREYMDVLIDAAKLLGYERLILVHGEPGIDEVSVSGKTFMKVLKEGKVTDYEITPEELGIKPIELKHVTASSAEESAMKILRASFGKDNEVSAFLKANIAVELFLLDKVKDMKDGYEMAQSLLEELPSRLKVIIQSHGNPSKLNDMLGRLQ
ncbi:anthranilate phosphoribosyltransferase [Sulfuracidifex tepidarius]|uniref:Anthranilate phosphoribosyltransferase n=1 Tax=Sulfuracidifex tepidarius TaxID=1294262 RepID=A0A510DUH1_9CREN|nr:anthranilate phosphoribosyltransferase [Sulfuracidifex tepidarius]BBG23817.1 Anthranilate phosphoribosyltransferase [Sulfuracidifex tepidarius]BBG26572.1 Anthranilate phosphoribosyltransferase [Sulfuracidifex tepidarius]